MSEIHFSLFVYLYAGLGQDLRKAFMVYGNNKLHRSQESLKSADKIVSATVTAADGSDVDLSDSISNLITIHYPNTVSTEVFVNISYVSIPLGEI